MRRLIQIVDRCMAQLNKIVVEDPTRPNMKAVATHQLPERLEAIRSDLMEIRYQLKDRVRKGDSK